MDSAPPTTPQEPDAPAVCPKCGKNTVVAVLCPECARCDACCPPALRFVPHGGVQGADAGFEAIESFLRELPTKAVVGSLEAAALSLASVHHALKAAEAAVWKSRLNDDEHAELRAIKAELSDISGRITRLHDKLATAYGTIDEE